MYTKYIKPILDISGAFILCILCSPLFLITSLVLLIDQRGKILFLQERPGRGEKIFKLIKFRSMKEHVNKYGKIRTDKERTSAFGNMIRKLSIDELPQLINVLKGDMSLIGPRPLLTEYLPYYSKEQAMRHLVKPGITGWAQVNYKYCNSWLKIFEYDVYYVKHVSILLDTIIAMKTIIYLFRSNKYRNAISNTMNKFSDV